MSDVNTEPTKCPPRTRQPLATIDPSIKQWVLDEKQHRRRAEALRKYIDITNNQITLENIVENLKSSVQDCVSGKGGNLETMLAGQAQLLDVIFSKFVDLAGQKSYFELDKLSLALKAQKQCETTINSMHKIKLIKNKIAKMNEQTRQKDKQTRQKHAPMD
jgi:hypothetical protein